MKVRLVAVLALALLGVLAIPVTGQAGYVGLSASQCSATEIARLSAAIEEARTAWAETLTARSFDTFRTARRTFREHQRACGHDNGAAQPTGIAPSGGQVQGPQSTSVAPYTVPPTGITVDIRSTSDEVAAGLDVVYNVTVTTGLTGGTSSSVVVTIFLPVSAGGAQYRDDTNASGCAFVSPNLTCGIGNMADGGDTRSFLVRLSTPPSLFLDGTTVLKAMAGVTRIEPDPVTADDVDFASTLVTERSDLHIFKFLMPTSPVAGKIAQYTIWVENRGPSTARNVAIRDTLLAGPADSTPAPLTVLSCAFTVSQGGGSITQFTCGTGDVVGTQFGTDAGTFRTNRLDPLAFDVPPPDPMDPLIQTGRLRLAFRLLFNRDITNVNMAAVESDTPDPDYSNNNATTFADVLAASNLALTKNATAEEQQVNQDGLMFNNAVFGQAFPTAPNYFVSTRVTAGRRIQYVLTVTNPGVTLADNVVLTDRLPAGVRIYQGSLAVTKVVLPSTTSSGGGTCVTGTPGDPGAPLVCNLGSIRPAGSGAADPKFDPATPISKTVTFEVIVDANVAAGSVLENDATVASSGIELDNTNNEAFTQNTVLAAADQTAQKVLTGQNLVFTGGRYVYQDIANQVTAGHVLRSSITIQNAGPSDSQNTTVQDQLPAVLGNGIMPLTFLRAENADCRPDAVHARDIFCSLGTMAAGERRTFDIYTLVDEQVPNGTLLSNCATALSGSSNVVPPGPPPPPPTGGPTQTLTWDPDTTNNQSCPSVTVNTTGNSPAQGLLIDKAGPASANVGDIVNYTLTVNNRGPGNATNAMATDYLPAELRNIVITPSQGSCNTGVPGDSSRPLVCNLGTVAAGATATVGIAAQIIPTLAGGSTIFNDAQVSSSATDAFNSDNIDTVATAINLAPAPAPTQADLGIAKTGTSAANPGQAVNYTLTITNAGPISASDVVATEFMPAELRNIVITPSQGSCNTGVPGDSTRPLVCNLGTVPAGGTPTIGIAAQVKPTVPGGASLSNDARVASSTTDPNNANNIVTWITAINTTRLPDGQIRRGSGNFVGDNIYNTTGAGQTKQGSAARGSTIKFRILVQTDAPSSDSFTILATGAATTEYTVKYFQGKTDITAAVVAGTYITPVLAPGAKLVIKANVKVKANATVGSSVTRLVTITSVGDGTKQDVVMFIGQRS